MLAPSRAPTEQCPKPPCHARHRQHNVYMSTVPYRTVRPLQRSAKPTSAPARVHTETPRPTVSQSVRQHPAVRRVVPLYAYCRTDVGATWLAKLLLYKPRTPSSPPIDRRTGCTAPYAPAVALHTRVVVVAGGGLCVRRTARSTWQSGPHCEAHAHDPTRHVHAQHCWCINPHPTSH